MTAHPLTIEPIEGDVAEVAAPKLGDAALASGTGTVVTTIDKLSELNEQGIGLSEIIDALKNARDALIEEEITADMVSYRKNVTGLDNTVFISVKFPRHGPRIKVAVDPPTHVDPMGNNASVAIEDGRVVAGNLSAGELAQVQRFIDLNRDVLLDYWEKRIDTDELRQRLRKI